MKPLTTAHATAGFVAIVAMVAPLPALAVENPLCAENRHSQALLIGNRDYQETFAVPYAHNDIAAMKKLLVERLCYREANIKVLKNATFNHMRTWLGTSKNPRGRFWFKAEKDKSNIFIYYSGHGVPDAARKAYLLPVDTDPNLADLGYGLDQLHENLRSLKARIGDDRSVTVVLDTCFSGRSAGGPLQRHSGAIRPVLPSERSSVNIVRFSASQAGKLAYWNDGRKLGLFTSVFVDAINGAADKAETGNNDGKITGDELSAYIAYEVANRANNLLQKEQTPDLPPPAAIGWNILLEPGKTSKIAHKNKEEVVLQIGHMANVNNVLFSRDGKLTISADDYGIVKIWDSKSGRLIRSIDAPDVTLSISLSPDETKLLTAGTNEAIILWDLETGRELNSFRGHGNTVSSIAFAPDGANFLSAGFDGTIRIWDATTGNHIRTLTGHEDSILSATFSRDGKLIASGDKNRIIIWDRFSGNIIRTRPISVEKGSVKFSKNGKFVMRTSFNGWTEISEVISGKVIKKSKAIYNSFSASSNGKYLALTGHDGKLSIIETETNKTIYSAVKSYTVNSVSFSENRRRIAIAVNKGHLLVLDSETLRIVNKFKKGNQRIHSVLFTTLGKRVVSTDDGNRLRFWNYNSGQLLQSIQGYFKSGHAIAFSPDGFSFGYAGTNGKSIRVRSSLFGLQMNKKIKSDNILTYITLSTDGSRVATAPVFGKIVVWDTHSGKPIRILKDHNPKGTYLIWNFSLSLSPDGKLLAAIVDRKAIIWDIRTGLHVFEIDLEAYDLNRTPSISFFSNKNFYIANLGTIDIYSITSGKKINSIKLGGKNSRANKRQSDIILSLNERYVASIGDGNAHIWNAKTGSWIRTIRSSNGYVTAIAISPDDKHLATGTSDGILQVWSVATGREIASLYGVGKSGAFIRFPDGYWTATSDVLKNSVHLVRGLKVLDTPPEKHPTFAGPYDTVTLAGGR